MPRASIGAFEGTAAAAHPIITLALDRVLCVVGFRRGGNIGGSAMSIPATCDVTIIGGGPSGSYAAASLAREGFDVVVLEKTSHPRNAVGESLIPDFWRYSDQIGATEKLEAEGFITKTGGIVDWRGELRGNSFGDFGFDRPAKHVERDRFDQIWFEHAGSLGAKTFENVTVTKFEGGTDAAGLDYSKLTYEDADGTEGHITSRYTIDASGQAAVLARQMGLREIVSEFRALALWGYFEGSNYLSIDGRCHPASAISSQAPVTFVTSLDDEDDGGWSWHIKLRDKTSVGLVLPTRWLKDLRHQGESWEDYFVRASTEEIPILRDLLAPSSYIGDFSSIRDYSSMATQVAGPGFFLAGDASGFIDPIFSVGVAIAFYSSAIAAWSAAHSIRNPESAERTRQHYSRQLYGRLEVARSLALPEYRSSGEVSALARESVQFMPPNVRQLMYSVALLTTRSSNWSELFGKNPPTLTDGQLKFFDRAELERVTTAA